MTMQSPSSSRLIDQEFGNCITQDDLIFPIYHFPGHNYYRPWRWALQNMTKDFGSTICDEKDKFRVSLDVQQFKPNEISVKVLNNEIIVEAKHEEREDGHGYVSRQFIRRYALPKECKSEDITSTLSSDGILIITANKITIDKEKVNERVVPIKFCSSTVRNAKLKSEEVTSETKSTNTEAKSKCGQDSKKDSQIMLREDHSRLLKPELLKADICEATATGTKTEKDTKSKIDELFAMSEKSSLLSSCMEKGAITTAATDKKVTGKEQIKMSEIMEGSSSMASSEIIGEACTTTASSKVFGESSMAAVSEIMSSTSKTSEVITSEESSSFSSSSMSSSLKVTSENLAELISAELKEAADNM